MFGTGFAIFVLLIAYRVSYPKRAYGRWFRMMSSISVMLMLASLLRLAWIYLP